MVISTRSSQLNSIASLVGRQWNEPRAEEPNGGEAPQKRLLFCSDVRLPASSKESNLDTTNDGYKRTCLRQSMTHGTLRSHASSRCVASRRQMGKKPTRTRLGPKPVRLAPSCRAGGVMRVIQRSQR